MGALTIFGSIAMFGASMLLSHLMPKPKIKPIKLSASTYGHMRPISNGNNEIGANVLWQTDVALKEDTVGKGAGGGTIIRGKASFMLGFGEAGINGRDIRQAWADGKLFYDNRLGSTKKKKYNTPIRIYRGTEEDLPDPFMEAHLGVGNVQAYRGEVHMFLESFPLEDYGNRPPNFTAEIVEAFSDEHHVTSVAGFAQTSLSDGAIMLDPRDDHPLIYATEIGIGLSGGFNTTDLAKINAITNEINYEQPGITSNAGNGVGSDISNDGYIFAEYDVSLSRVGVGKYDAANGTLVGFAHGVETWKDIPGFVRVDRVSDSKLVAHFASVSAFGLSGSFVLFDQDSLSVMSETPRSAFGITGGGSARRLTDSTFDKDGHTYVLVQNTGTGDVEIWTPSGTGASLFVNLSSHFSSGNLPDQMLWFPEDNSLILGGHGRLLKYSLDDLDVVNTLTVSSTSSGMRTFHNAKMQDTIWLPDTVSDSSVSVPGGSSAIFPAFQEIHLRTLTKGRLEVFREAASIYPIPGFGYFRPTDAQFDPDQEVIWSQAFVNEAIGRFSMRGGAASVTLRNVVEAYSVRVGLDVFNDIDASLLDTDSVEGYVMSERQPCRTMLEPLLDAHAVDVVETHGKILFVPRGSASVLTIPQHDLAAHSPSEQRALGDLIEVRKEERELPASIDITFYRSGDYEQGHARAFRSERNVYTDAEVTIEYPEVFSGHRAQQIVERKLFEAWINRTSYSLTTMPKYFQYDPTDVISAMVEGVLFTMRLTKVDTGANWVLKWDGVATDVSVYDGLAQPPAPIPSPPGGGIPVVSPTVAYYLNMPMLRENSDNDAGFYVAATPELGEDATWGGTVIFRSMDGATYDSFLEDTSAATMGYALTVLPSVARPTVWDRTSTLNIKLFSGGAENFTEADLLHEKNVWWIGGELCQPGSATPFGGPNDNTWTLGPPWIRGRKGTEEWANGIKPHVIGEQVVLLDTATLRRAFQPASEIGATRYYEAATYGNSIDSVTPQLFVDTAAALKPFSPMGITGARDGSNNLTITWTRRSRFSASFSPLMSPIVGEDSESYQVDILDGTIVKRTITAASPTASYSAANQTTDGFTPGNPIDVKIYQMSAVVGRGTGREAII